MGYFKLIVYILQDLHVIIMNLICLSCICLIVFVNLMAQLVKTSATGLYSVKRHWWKPNYLTASTLYQYCSPQFALLLCLLEDMTSV